MFWQKVSIYATHPVSNHFGENKLQTIGHKGHGGVMFRNGGQEIEFCIFSGNHAISSSYISPSQAKGRQPTIFREASIFGNAKVLGWRIQVDLVPRRLVRSRGPCSTVPAIEVLNRLQLKNMQSNSFKNDHSTL